MMKYLLTIQDRQGRITQSRVDADSEGLARIAASDADPKLCANSYVVLENAPQYERQIIRAELSTEASAGV